MKSYLHFAARTTTRRDLATAKAIYHEYLSGDCSKLILRLDKQRGRHRTGLRNNLALFLDIYDLDGHVDMVVALRWELSTSTARSARWPAPRRGPGPWAG